MTRKSMLPSASTYRAFPGITESPSCLGRTLVGIAIASALTGRRKSRLDEVADGCETPDAPEQYRSVPVERAIEPEQVMSVRRQ